MQYFTGGYLELTHFLECIFLCLYATLRVRDGGVLLYFATSFQRFLKITGRPSERFLFNHFPKVFEDCPSMSVLILTQIIFRSTTPPPLRLKLLSMFI